MPITFGVILSPNPCSEISINSQIDLGTSDKNTNSKVLSIKILLDSGASASIGSKDVFYAHHKILKDKKNKCSNMAGTFNTTFVTEIIFILPEWNHSMEFYVQCNLTNKLLNGDILHGLGIVFNFKNKTIAWQEVSISMNSSNCTEKNSL